MNLTNNHKLVHDEQNIIFFIICYYVVFVLEFVLWPISNFSGFEIFRSIL